MSFTPNMTVEEIMEQDKKRGEENSDRFDTWPKDDRPHSSGTETLKSFLQELQVKKAASYEEDPDKEDISKPMPSKPKRKDESEFQHKIRQWEQEVKDRPKRFPGGHKQAVAIAAQQAGVSKGTEVHDQGKLSETAREEIGRVGSEEREKDPAHAYLLGKERKYPVKRKKNGKWEYDANLLLAAARRARMQGKDALASRADSIRERITKGIESLFDMSKAEKEEKEIKLELEGVKELELEGPEEVELEVEKALNTRSFYVPRPVGPYDPFGVYRSATTQTNRRYSKLSGDVAPMVADTLNEVSENEKIRNESNTYKSCGAHGVIHRSNGVCGMCMTISKGSPMCKCGEPMIKRAGGGYKCNNCE